MNLNPIRSESMLIVEVQCKHIDAENSVEFKREILALLSEPCDTILDLSELTFIDSSGLGVLLACMRRVRAAGCRLRLCGLQPPVKAIVELVHLDRVIEIDETREQATAAGR
jgi:anti-sigma B factor antagonist